MKLNPFSKTADKICLMCESSVGKNPLKFVTNT